MLTVGKQSAPFTLDGATSSRELLTIDRSNLANNIWFPQEYLPGVSLSGRRAPWVYRVGVYSSGAMNREFGEFNGGTATLGVHRLRLRAAARRAARRCSPATTSIRTRIATTRSRGSSSTSARSTSGSKTAKWGARADFSTASGYLGQSGMWAIQAHAVLQRDGQASSRRPLHVHRERRSQRRPARHLREPGRVRAGATNTTSCISARTTTSTATG